MLQTRAELCHFTVCTALTVAVYWAISSASVFVWHMRPNWQPVTPTHSPWGTGIYSSHASGKLLSSRRPGHLQQGGAQGAFCSLIFALSECKSHMSSRREGIWADHATCWPWLWAGRLELGSGSLGSIRSTRINAEVVWSVKQRHWEKSGQDISVSTFWTLPLQIACEPL